MDITTIIMQILLPILTGAFGWLFSKLQTKREQKKSDLELINESIRPLLESIKELSNKYSDITKELMQERERNNAYQRERVELISKIDDLEREVKRLSKIIKNLKDEKDNSNNTV